MLKKEEKIEENALKSEGFTSAGTTSTRTLRTMTEDEEVEDEYKCPGEIPIIQKRVTVKPTTKDAQKIRSKSKFSERASSASKEKKPEAVLSYLKKIKYDDAGEKLL